MRLSSDLVLASGSPRRKSLLQEMGLEFRIQTVPFEENFPSSMAATEVAGYLAKRKNEANRAALKKEIVLTADTVVIVKDKILGKPESKDEAIKVLEGLSDQIHQVTTGVCISDPQKAVSFSCTTEVKFRVLDIEEIQHYVNKWTPFDKAGSYAIQEWIGLVGIEWIRGSYYNVVGLPTQPVYDSLKSNFSA
ncbi:MAG: Maf family nucleotide pyrophosphatase [Bacteroidota bacterium]